MRRMLGVLMFAACLAGGGHADAPTPTPDAVAATPTVEPPRPAPAAPPVPAATGTLDPAAVICERAARCGTIGRSQLDECRKGPDASRLTLVWGSEDELGIPELVAQGRLRRDLEAERACLEFLVTAPCDLDPRTTPGGCSTGLASEQLAPGVAPGGECTGSDECVDGFCARTRCKGVCKARSRLGEACGADQICGDDGYCWDDRCQPRADVGATCGGHWQWCKDGLFCDGYQPAIETRPAHSPEVLGKCSAGKQLGEACVPPRTASGEVCLHGLYCDWGLDQPVCQTMRAAGEACGSDSACADGLRCAGLVLGGLHPAGRRFATRKAGRCAPTLDAGDACDPAAFVSGCPTSMVCDAQLRTCRSTGHTGDPCVSSWITQPHPPDEVLRTDGCFSSHYCDVKTRTCQPQRANGERCTPQKSGVEDDPCFFGKCDAHSRRCVNTCE